MAKNGTKGAAKNRSEGKRGEAGRVTLETVRRFGKQFNKMAIARYLVAIHPLLFVNKDGNPDEEVARDYVRKCSGAHGDEIRGQRERAGTLVECPPVPPPQQRSVARTPHRLHIGLWLNLPDVHIPFHDQRALESAVAYGQKQKVDGILLSGDAQDCEALSYWKPTRKRDFPAEVEAMIDFLDWLRGEFPKAKMVWKPGNHEDRAEDYYRAFAPHLADLPSASLDTLLGLAERKITWLGRKQLVKAGKLPIIHGHEVRGGSTIVNPARWLFLKWKGSAMCSHFHRSSQHDETTGDGDLVTTWSTGCLCDLSPDYNPFSNSWTHGFALINVEKGGNFEVNNRRILPDGTVV